MIPCVFTALHGKFFRNVHRTAPCLEALATLNLVTSTLMDLCFLHLIGGLPGSHEMQTQVYWDGLCSISLQLLCLRWSLFGSPIVSLRSPGPRSFTVSPTDVQPLCLDQSKFTKRRSFNGPREATPKTQQNCSCFQGKTWQELWNQGAPYLPGQLPFALRSGPLVFA